MENNNNIQDELKDIAPLLAKMKGKEDGYTVPHLYFESLQDKVLAAATKETEKISIFTRFFQPRIVAMFASIAVLLVAGIFLLNQTENEKVATLEDISTEELSLYMDENIDNFDLDLLFEGDSPEFDIDFEEL